MREPVISLHVQGRSPDGNGVEGVSEDAVCGGLAFVAARAPKDDDDDAPAVARRREGDGRAGGPRVAGLESVAARDGAAAPVEDLVRAFVARMNRRAKALGMVSTRYESPNGLPPDLKEARGFDTSTARDLAKLCRALVKTDGAQSAG